MTDQLRPRDYAGHTPDDVDPAPAAKPDPSLLIKNPYPVGSDQSLAWVRGCTDGLLYMASLSVADMRSIVERWAA